MRRAIICALALSGSGCMNLDFVVLDGEDVDEPNSADAAGYELSRDIIADQYIEEITFQSTDGTLLTGVWATHDEPKPPLIYFHGNTNHLGRYWHWIELYWQWDTHDIFIFDYRGYGKSEGSSTYDIIEEDGLAAVGYVSDHTGTAPEDIPMIALSLGASVLVHTNDEIGAQSIIIHDMFLSTTASGNDGTGLDLPNGWLFASDFDNGTAVQDIQSPIFVIHGEADDYVQSKYATEVYDNAPDPKELWIPPGINHARIVDDIPDEYSDRAVEWLERWD